MGSMYPDSIWSYIAQRNECGKKDPQELRDFLNDVRQASYSIRNHIERNFGAKEQVYITDEFAIGDPVKIPETKDEKPSEKASGKEKKQRASRNDKSEKSWMVGVAITEVL